MAKSGQSLFIEEDDNDVNTTTTEEDYDPSKEYDVECVLAEQRSEDGNMHYLIKWEGYPLYDSTWETKESITSDVVIRHWEADKRLIKSGEKQPFDVDDYDRAFEEHAEEQERKRKLRKKKRRQRGKVVTSSEEDSDSTSSYNMPTTETPKRSRTNATSPIKEKGVAQPLAKRRNTFSKITSSVSEGSRPVTQHSDLDSVFGEPIEKAVPPPPPGPKISAPSTSKSTSKEATQKEKNVTTSTQMNQAASASSKPTSSPPTEQRKASVSTTTNATTSARKSAPIGAVATAKPASKSNVFANWTRAKKPRQRPRVSGETEKDSTDPKFMHLAVQNRYQKYSRNEPAPNPDALVIIDPKTGKMQPSKTPNARSGPEDIHSAYGRGRSPPQQKQRTPSPPSSPRPKPTEIQNQTDTSPAPGAGATNQRPFELSVAGRGPKILDTCRYWEEGNCRFTSDTCRFVHGEVPVGLQFSRPKKEVTCYWWATYGKCRKSDKECEFCHFNTGETAGEPGSFLRRQSVAAANASMPDVGQVSIASPTEQLPTPSSPVVQFALTATLIQTPPPVEPDKEPPPSEPITDPRLRGRAPRVSDISVRSSEEPVNVERPIHVNDPSLPLASDVEMSDSMDISHGSLEQDLEMAKHGIPKLDPARLFASVSSNEKKKIDIRHVYLHMPNRPEELELLRKYFKGLNRQVYTCKEDGAWSLFTENYAHSSLVIVHPTELFNGTILGLYDLLVRHGASFSVFSIGVQYARCIRESRKPAFEAQRLFPHGDFTFISDDVFVYYPEKATRLIEEFITVTAYKTKVGSPQLGKIAARPGIKMWLLRLACSKMEEHAGDGAAIPYVQLYDAICRLCPLEDEDLAYPELHTPKVSSYLWSVLASSLPSFEGRWESGDEEAATDYMANFFAGEACGKAWKYRKFHFVYERPEHTSTETNSQGIEEEVVEKDPKGWGKLYSHIGVVRPDKLFKKQEK